MGRGEILLIKFGGEYQDPFLDDYQQEIFACHDIIDKIKLMSEMSINITIDKRFLTSIIKSHLNNIKKTYAD